MATREERVVLRLDDQFSTRMAHAAAQTALLNRNLHDLDGSSSSASRSQSSLSRDVDRTSDSFRRGGADIDRYSGRLSLLAEAAVGLGPALIPIGAAAIPAVTGLASALGAAAGAAGVTMLAFHGVGDALKALDAAQLDPSAENLEKLQQSMDALGPAGAQFVSTLDQMEGPLESLQRLAGAGIFPGFEDGLNSILTLMPQVRGIVGSLADEVGRLGADAGKSLSSDADWQSFFDYIRTDAAPTLDQFARSVGNFTAGLASILTGFAPLSEDFSSGLLDMSRSFREWADGLSDTQGFQDFINYIRESGPDVREFATAAANALLALGKAMAPWGSAVLPVLTDVLKLFTAIADSPIGPTLYSAAAAMLFFNRAAKMVGVTMPLLSTAFTGIRTDLGILTTSFMTAGATTEREAARIAAARKSLGSTAVGTGVAIASWEIGKGTLSQMDSASRSRDAANATADSYSQLSKALSASNVGKYADDLHINLDKLSQDLYENGKSGTYAAGVIDKLHDSSHGFMAMLKGEGGAIVPGWTNNTEKAADANRDLYKILGNNKSVLGAGAAAQDDYAQSSAYAAAQSAAEARSLNQATTAMQRHRSAALSAFDAETQWRQALSEAKQQADTNSKGIRGNSDAALANRAALGQLASAWNGQSAAVKNSQARFKQARSAFIDTATAMGVPIAQAKRLAAQLLEIPKSRVVTVEMQAAQAFAQIDEVQRRLSALHDKTVTTFMRTVQLGHHTTSGTIGGPVYENADGGTIAGARHPYGDKVLSWLAPGEEVITNRHGEADRYRADRDAGRIPRYADGGTVHDIVAGTAHSTRGQKGFVSLGALAKEIDTLTGVQFKRLGKAIGDLSDKRLNRLGSALDTATTAAKSVADADADRLKTYKSNRTDLASTMAGSLRSDLWGQQASGGAFSSSTGTDPLSILRGDIASSNKATSIERGLERKGISDAVLQSVASEGGLAGLQQIQGYSKSQVAELNRLYAQRQASSQRAGNIAGQAVWGDEIAKQTKVANRSEAHLRNLNTRVAAVEKAIKAAEKHADKSRHNAAEHAGHTTGKAVNGAAAKGKRNQKRSAPYRAK